MNFCINSILINQRNYLQVISGVPAKVHVKIGFIQAVPFAQ
jgi:hypothetical protein